MLARCIRVAALCVVGTACGEPELPPPTAVQPVAVASAQAHDPEDALLAVARATLANGRIEPSTRASLLASPSDRHRRAQRLLAALDGTPSLASVPVDAEPADNTFEVPPLQLTTPPPPLEPEPSSAAAAHAARDVVVPKPARTTSVAAPSGSVPVPSVAPTLRGVTLRSTSSGASLTLQGSQGLVVGVANQPDSGIVRLVVEAGASAAALAARPRIEGAKVTSVRRVGDTVFVTLSLDPGWRLDKIAKARTGARVQLRRSR